MKDKIMDTAIKNLACGNPDLALLLRVARRALNGEVAGLSDNDVPELQERLLKKVNQACGASMKTSDLLGVGSEYWTTTVGMPMQRVLAEKAEVARKMLDKRRVTILV